MSHTYYNSLDTACKTPFGAVPAGQEVTFRLTVPESLGYVDPHLVLTKDREAPVHYRMEFAGQTPQQNHFTFTIAPTTPGLYFYHFDLYTDFRRIYRDAGGEGVLSWTDGTDWQLTVYEPDFKTPDWIKNGTMYQIFPDRFCEGKPGKPMPFADRIYREDKTGEPYFWPTEQQEGYLNMDYYGGDFAGIQQKLPYLCDLGVSCIYLNPIFEAHANHRYNTANYLKADPLLGTNEEFAALCAAAAKEGIRIILDGVFSHTGSDSVYFNREGRYGPGGAYRDRNSPYRSWYDFDSGYPSGYRCWWGFETLPEVQEDSPSYIDFVCGKGGVIDTWLGLGASGFRLDVADELPDAFIERIRQAVKAHGEDKLLIGEVWEDATTKEAFGRRRTYLRGKGLELAWLSDPVDAFFLQVQGSGRLRFEDGKEMPVRFAGSNGKPYLSIGRYLADQGEIPTGQVSMQSIRQWLREHPELRDDLLRRNQRYIFFRKGPETSSGSITSGPVGSMGSPLSSMVSLAVDRTTFPLGSVLAFDVNIPDPSSPVEEGPVSTTPLFGIGLAQDTGEAIKGRRVDLFCGKGARAAYIAGHLNGPGEIWMLLAK